MEINMYIPTKLYWQGEKVSKLKAEGLEGHFTLLPAHIDYVSVLVPGILILNQEKKELIFAVDEGTLVKQGSSVRISCRNAVQGDDLQTLHQVVQEEYKQIDELEKKAKSALIGLEYGMIRRFAEIGGEK
ncbi:MAG: F0F1 ATP synthase subunit epsilon [Thermodesulfobacteriota bacterium]